MRRKTCCPSAFGSHAIPNLGCHIFLSDGIVPSEGNVKRPCAFTTVESIQGRKNTCEGGVIGSGSIWASHRNP